MPSREELCRWDREHVWHAFTQMAEYEPLVIERAEGCTLYDLDGRAYLDGVASLWCNIHGHRHPRLDAALREQLERLAHVTNLGASNSTTIELARRLVELAPGGPCDSAEPMTTRTMPDDAFGTAAGRPTEAANRFALNHVFFSSDGSSAVEAALKMALQYWRQRSDPRPDKTLYVAYGDAYHGDTLGSVSVGGVERFQRMFEPLLFETLRLPTPRGELNAEVERLERLLAENHPRIAALVIEPLVQCAAGIVAHPAGYLRAARELTRRYDVLLIADEVAVGFGRTGSLFACQQEHVVPDLMCLGKGLSGGYLPIAATLATREIWSAFLGPTTAGKQFFHGHTYGGNPLAAAVALASIEVFQSERVLEQLSGKVQCLAKQLERLSRHEHVGRITQRGLIAGIELVESRQPWIPFPAAEQRGMLACRAARERGVLLRPLGDVLVIMPPLAISLGQLEQLATAVEHGIVAATGEPMPIQAT